MIVTSFLCMLDHKGTLHKKLKYFRNVVKTNTTTKTTNTKHQHH